MAPGIARGWLTVTAPREPGAVGPGFKGIVLFAAIVLVVIGMHLAAPVLVPFLFAVFLAIVTAPLVTLLLRLKAPSLVAVGLAIVLDLAAIVGVGMLTITSMTELGQLLPDYQTRLGTLLAQINAFLQSRALPFGAPDLMMLFDPALLVGFVGTFIQGAAGVLSNLVLVLIILVFILVEAPGLRSKLVVLTDDRGEAGRLSGAARDMQRYLLVKTASSAVTALFVGLWLWAVGVDLPVLWGLVAFLLNFVPTIGSIIAALPPLLVALLMDGVGTAVLVAAGYTVINFSIGNFIEPRILGRAVGLSPLVVVLSVLFWGFVLGPAGALLSVPLTVAVKIVLDGYEDLRWVAVLLGPSPPP